MNSQESMDKVLGFVQESEQENLENSQELDSSNEDVAEERDASSSSDSDFYQNKRNLGSFSYDVPHEALYKFLTSEGYQWTGEKCKNWEIVSVWEPSVFLHQFANMKRGYSSLHLNLDVLRNLVSECLSPFQLALENIIAPGSNFVVVRIDQDVKKSKDSYCLRTFTLKLECSEIFVGKNFTTVKGTPVTIFGGGKFCKILYETMRKNDIIIIAGTIKRVTFPHGSLRIVLLNHNVKNFDVTLLRFSFLPSSSDFSIMEKMKPIKESPNEYAFNYCINHRNMLFHHEEQSGYNFRPIAPNSFHFSKLWTPSATRHYIGMPIKFDDDVKIIYQNLTQKLKPTNAEMLRPRTSPQPQIPRIRKYPFNQIFQDFKLQCLQKISIYITAIFFIALIFFFANFISDVVMDGRYENVSVTHNESCSLKTDTVVLQDIVPNIFDANDKDQPEIDFGLIEYSKNPIIEYIEYTGSILQNLVRYLKISCIWAYQNMGFQYIWEWLKGHGGCGGQTHNCYDCSMRTYNYYNNYTFVGIRCAILNNESLQLII